MGATRRAALRRTRERRQRDRQAALARELRPAGRLIRAPHGDPRPAAVLHDQRRDAQGLARHPVVLKVAIPANTDPVIRSVVEEAARRIADVALVRLWPVARLPGDIPLTMIMRDGRRPSARWQRAAVAFGAALSIVAGETLAAAGVDDGILTEALPGPASRHAARARRAGRSGARTGSARGSRDG